MVDWDPKLVEKPWGHEIWWAHTDQYAGKILVVNAGQALSLQLHRKEDESSYLLSGRLRLTRGANAEKLEEQEIAPGQAWRVEPGTVHPIEALEDSVVLEVSTPELEALVRLRDRYGRRGYSSRGDRVRHSGPKRAAAKGSAPQKGSPAARSRTVGCLCVLGDQRTKGQSPTPDSGDRR
jgi:mannose-6-phosphate isomerase